MGINGNVCQLTIYDLNALHYGLSEPTYKVLATMVYLR